MFETSSGDSEISMFPQTFIMIQLIFAHAFKYGWNFGFVSSPENTASLKADFSYMNILRVTVIYLLCSGRHTKNFKYNLYYES